MNYHGTTSVNFLGKVYCEACRGGAKSGMPCFLCQSLLLSTIVLNDNYF